MKNRFPALCIALFWFAAAAGTAQEAGDEDRTAADLAEEMLLAADSVLGEAGEANLLFDGEVAHYDDNGYPEDEDGLLVMQLDPDGPIVYVEDDRIPYLLYAQYENRQRDAVFLARTGTISDVLPTGEEREIPYGYGAVKFNTVYVSILEGLLVPHFSDNQKTYVDFPLRDLYVGGSFGLTGITAVARYVHLEQFVAEAQIGFNPFGSFNASSVMNRYWIPIHIGGGYRFPGVFPELLGENVWTVGADLLLGLGDRDNDPTSRVILPGAYLDIERVLYDEEGRRRDYREDPRPYNYTVNSLSLRAGVYFNFAGIASGTFIVPEIALRYQYSIIGPKIPEHEFKETNVLYVNEIYRDDLERQAERRRARAERESEGN